MYLALQSNGGRLLLDLLQSEADSIINLLEDWNLTADRERQLHAYLKAYRSILRTLKSHQRQLVEEFHAKYDVEGPAVIQEGVSDELDLRD